MGSLNKPILNESSAKYDVGDVFGFKSVMKIFEFTPSFFEVFLKALTNETLRPADVINMSSTGSSDEKGESLLNTVETLESIGANLLVMRHYDSGAPYFVARNINIPIINAGDGSHAHPTQNLIDLYTVYKQVGDIDGLNLTILGDNIHSRVARSTALGFSAMGANITFCAPPTMDAKYLSNHSTDFEGVHWPKVTYTHDIKSAFNNCSDFTSSLHQNVVSSVKMCFTIKTMFL